MKKYIKIIMTIFLFFTFFINVYSDGAPDDGLGDGGGVVEDSNEGTEESDEGTEESNNLEAPTNLKINSNTNTSVDLSWDEVKEAYVYSVKYGKKSGLESGYDNESDLIDTTSTKIENLQSNIDYYFVVVSIDEQGNESGYSNEVVVNTSNNSESKFILKTVNNISLNKVVSEFSNPLENKEDSTREFKIVNTKDSLDSFEVIKTTLDNENEKKLILELDKNLVVGEEYELTVIAINDNNGNSIESGIDSIEVFIAEGEEEDVELNSAGTQDEVKENNIIVSGPTGENIDKEVVENTTLGAAKQNEKLPKTGPEHIFILILSILLGTFMFIFKYKKS